MSEWANFANNLNLKRNRLCESLKHRWSSCKIMGLLRASVCVSTANASNIIGLLNCRPRLRWRSISKPAKPHPKFLVKQHQMKLPKSSIRERDDSLQSKQCQSEESWHLSSLDFSTKKFSPSKRIDWHGVQSEPNQNLTICPATKGICGSLHLNKHTNSYFHA